MTDVAPLLLGIDLGGTKIEGVALDGEGRELARRRVPTPRDDYDATLAAIVALVGWLEAETGRRGTVGVGMPGCVSPWSGLVKNANSTWLNGRAFDRDLERALGRAVRTANDANCLAVSEAVDGVAAGAAMVFAVILGTGVGAGIAVGGRAHAGPNGVAGEWGHNPLAWPSPDEQPGPACYCGKHGCLETWLSGGGLAGDLRRATGEVGALRAEDVVARAERGDPAAERVLVRYAGRLARGLAHVIDVLDPDVIVLAGGLSQLDRLYRDVPPQLARWVIGAEAHTPLLRARHGDSSGVRGAAWLWKTP